MPQQKETSLIPNYVRIVIALDEMYSSGVLSLLVFCLIVAVGVGGSVEKDQSVGTGRDGTPAGGVWLSY